MFAILDQLTVKLLNMFRYVRNLKTAIEHLDGVNTKLKQSNEALLTEIFNPSNWSRQPQIWRALLAKNKALLVDIEQLKSKLDEATTTR